MIFGKLVCFALRKHKRGRPVAGDVLINRMWYECPRCSARWTRPIRKRMEA